MLTSKDVKDRKEKQKPRLLMPLGPALQETPGGRNALSPQQCCFRVDPGLQRNTRLKAFHSDRNCSAKIQDSFSQALPTMDDVAVTECPQPTQKFCDIESLRSACHGPGLHLFARQEGPWTGLHLSKTRQQTVVTGSRSSKPDGDQVGPHPQRAGAGSLASDVPSFRARRASMMSSASRSSVLILINTGR